jgi:ankyrin repeat protein
MIEFSIKRYPKLEELKDLINRGLDINIIDDYGHSPLTHLCDNENITFEVLELMVLKWKNKRNKLKFIEFFNVNS